MTYKKIICPLVLGITSSLPVHAGAMGAEYTGPSYKGIYVEANVGYANHPWTNDRTPTSGLENQLGVLVKTSNMNGGAIGGADIGYQFTPHIALEGGWFYIPKTSYNRYRTVELPVAQTTFTLPEGTQVNINSGVAYLAFKGIIPIHEQFNAFAKLGAAYTYNSTNVNLPASLVNSPTVYTTDHSNYWNPLLGFGLQYATMNNWLFNVQYNYVPAYRQASSNHFITPSIQTVTFGLGYKFATL